MAQDKSSKAVRKLLSGGVPSDHDQEDNADAQWEWIYASSSPQDPESDNETSSAQTPQETKPHHGRKRKASQAFLSQSANRIIGARLGSLELRVGDAVTLKGDRDVWVALITEFIDADGDEEDEMAAIFMWLTSPKDIYNKSKRRNDALPNELYITASMDENPLDVIIGKADIVSVKKFRERHPSGRIPKGSPDMNKLFVCRRGANTRTATYTDEFIWEDTYSGAKDIDTLREKIENETKATRKQKPKSSAVPREEMADFVVSDGEDDGPKTPRKKRKTETSVCTPKSKPQKTPNKFTTPTHRRIVTKKPLEFTPLGTRILPSLTGSPRTPHSAARSLLHVSTVPEALPCREEEFATVYSHLESAITDGTGTCIYISGTPGTGKTATVREVVAQLHASVQAEELDDFIFVEINGMKLTDPHQSYSMLWEALTGTRVASGHALGLLSREFERPSPRRVPCVVLMDELDQLATRNQNVMYNFFNWPNLQHSRLIVLAVANTMDLPERTLSNKISSRLGLTRITFQGYTHPQLIRIITERLLRVPGNVVDPDAIQFASRKVAQVSGDARRALDICRRAVEIAEAEVAINEAADSGKENEAPVAPDTPSKSGRRGSLTSANAAQKPKPFGRVTIATVQRAIREATTSPLAQYLKQLPLASKLFLAALLARTRRTGVSESTLGDVVDEAKKICGTTEMPALKEWLMVYPADQSHDTAEDVEPSLGRSKTAMARARMMAEQREVPLKVPMPRVLGIGAAGTELLEAGVIVAESGRGMRVARVRLQVGEDEVRGALRDDEEVGGLGFSS